MIARCPAAAQNPLTGQAFDEKHIRQVFTTKCYDLDPSVPWERVQPLSKTALPDWLMKFREGWGKQVLDLELPAAWYERHCIWLDPCSSVIPGSPRSVFDQTQSNNGKGPRWMSKDARIYSRNLRASPYAGHQAQWGDQRVWWFMVFTRGHIKLCIMKDDWQQNADGMAQMVSKLPQVLEDMLGDGPKPRVVFSDRGPGFYQGSHGAICGAYSRALTKDGFRPFAGANASWQPPDIADLLLHESVAGNIRRYFRRNPIKWGCDLKVNYKKFVQKMKECEVHLNTHHNLKSLSRAFPNRVKKMVKEKGRRQRW